MSVIVAISGGKASSWCADWALTQYPKGVYQAIAVKTGKDK